MFKSWVCCVAAAAFLAAAGPAAAATPSEESVATLLEVTRAEAMLDQAYAGMEQNIRLGMAQAVAGTTLNEEQRRVVEAAPARLAEVLRQELNWRALRPVYIAIYRESFDQADVDGLIAFYRSPVGQSFVDKMPAVMQRSMGVIQTQMQAVLPRLKQAMDDVLREARLPPRS